MTEPFTFYRAADPVKGSWDGYGFLPSAQNDFLAFVADAPSGASIHTPELIKQFWIDYCRKTVEIGPIELADGINRLQDSLQQRGQAEGAIYQATLCVVSKRASTLLYCTIGDSTLQIFRNGKIYRLSEAEIWNAGFIFDPTEKALKRTKTQTLRFVGTGGEFVSLSQISSFPLQQHDLLSLSTDGMEDIVPPDRLIALFQSRPESMREELEKICAQEKLKDDATILSIEVQIPEIFSAEKTTASLSTQLSQLRKEQDKFRSDLTNLTSASHRLERMERSIQDLSRQVQSLRSGNRAYSVPRKTIFQRVSLWYIVLLAFVAGIAAAVGFVSWRRPEVRRTPVVSSSPATAPSARTVVAPPEIPPVQNCTYIVQKGDTLQRISEKQNVSLPLLLQQNPVLQKSSTLQVGQKLILCGEEP